MSMVKYFTPHMKIITLYRKLCRSTLFAIY